MNVQSISFWTPVISHGQQKPYKQIIAEGADFYFHPYLNSKIARRIDLSSSKVILEDNHTSWVRTLLKVVSYVTIIIPLIMLLIKTYFRAGRQFTVETKHLASMNQDKASKLFQNIDYTTPDAEIRKILQTLEFTGSTPDDCLKLPPCAWHLIERQYLKAPSYSENFYRTFRSVTQHTLLKEQHHKQYFTLNMKMLSVISPSELPSFLSHIYESATESLFIPHEAQYVMDYQHIPLSFVMRIIDTPNINTARLTDYQIGSLIANPLQTWSSATKELSEFISFLKKLNLERVQAAVRYCVDLSACTEVDIKKDTEWAKIKEDPTKKGSFKNSFYAHQARVARSFLIPEEIRALKYKTYEEYEAFVRGIIPKKGDEVLAVMCHFKDIPEKYEAYVTKYQQIAKSTLNQYVVSDIASIIADY